MSNPWPAGEVINTGARLRRLSGSIPTSYTIMKIDSTYYAECNLPGGTAVSSSTDAATVMQNALDALPNGGVIAYRGGTYDWGSTTIEATFSGNDPITIVGEGRNTIITGDADPSMFDVTNSSWIAGKEHPLIMEGLRFNHDCPASGITLDLEYCDPVLKRVYAYNVNATRQGTGIKMGPYDNTGLPIMEKVYSGSFDVDYDLAIDHLTATNLYTLYPLTSGIYLHNCSHVLIQNPHLYSSGYAFQRMFHIKHVGLAITIDNMSCEQLSAAQVVYMDADQNNMPFFRGNILIASGDVFTNDWTKIRVRSGGARVITQKVLQNVEVNIAETTIAHGLSCIPNIVAILPIGSGALYHFGESKNADATNIYLKSDADNRWCDIFVARW